jgi:hypothetical protein
MRRAVISAAVVFAAVFAGHPALAQQGQVPLPGGGFKPPPLPPIKPYQAVAVKPPAPFNDPTFVAFRKQLADVAAHKDRAALAKMVVAQNFFWLQDKNLADPHKPGIDNLAKAIDLGSQDDAGWQILTGLAAEPSASESPQQKGVFCAPADPNIDASAFETLGKETGTDPNDWGYPTQDGVEVYAAARPGSPVIDKLGLNLVHVLPDSGPPANANDPFMLHVATPAGKAGYVDSQLLAPLGSDQICYTKDAGGWKITGYLGGASQ